MTPDLTRLHLLTRLLRRNGNRAAANFRSLHSFVLSFFLASMLGDSPSHRRPRPEWQEAATGLDSNEEEARRRNGEEGEAASQRTAISASNGIQKQEKDNEAIWIDWDGPNDPSNPFVVSSMAFPHCGPFESLLMSAGAQKWCRRKKWASLSICIIFTAVVVSARLRRSFESCSNFH